MLLPLFFNAVTGSVPSVLQEVDLDVYNNTECQQTFQASTLYDINLYLTEGVMCAANGTTGGQDSCRVSIGVVSGHLLWNLPVTE